MSHDSSNGQLIRLPSRCLPGLPQPKHIMHVTVRSSRQGAKQCLAVLSSWTPLPCLRTCAGQLLCCTSHYCPAVMLPAAARCCTHLHFHPLCCQWLPCGRIHKLNPHLSTTASPQRLAVSISISKVVACHARLVGVVLTKCACVTPACHVPDPHRHMRVGRCACKQA